MSLVIKAAEIWHQNHHRCHADGVGGRNPILYKKLARKSGMTLSALYTEYAGSPAWMAFGTDISKMMADLFIKEIT